MPKTPNVSAEAPAKNAQAAKKLPTNEGESAQDPAEGADDVDPPFEGSARG